MILNSQNDFAYCPKKSALLATKGVIEAGSGNDQHTDAKNGDSYVQEE